jgi:hypothetical protein
MYITTKNINYMPKTPLKYTKVIQTPITDIQDQTLKKLKSYNVKIPQFVREAISEKIKREANHLIPKKTNEIEYCPFSNGTIRLN